MKQLGPTGPSNGMPAESFPQSTKFLLSKNSALCQGSSWRGFPVVEAGALVPKFSLISYSNHRATVMRVDAINYTGFLREICAEPIIPGDEEREIDPCVQLTSDFAGDARLLEVKKNCVGWMAEPLEAKKITKGQYVMSAPPITSAIQEIARPVKFLSNQFRAVSAIVRSVRNVYYRERPMIELTITGAPGVLCDGFVAYSAVNVLPKSHPVQTSAQGLLQSFLHHQEMA